jgi:nitrite reductase/ring-hydroxylating ferredoxin subunit
VTPPGEDWIRVCRVDELPPGEARYVENTPPIALFNVEGGFYATSDTCTHSSFSLATGYVDGDEVECALHMATFCIKDGRALKYPATEPLQVFGVDVVDGVVFVSREPRP